MALTSSNQPPTAQIAAETTIHIMTNSTEGLALAEIIFYAIATIPAFYCFAKHGKHGLLGWLYVILMCALRLVGNSMAYHAMSTTGQPNVAASIINGIGLSPLLMASLGLLSESYVLTAALFYEK